LVAAFVSFLPALSNAQLTLYPTTETGYVEDCNLVEASMLGLRDIAVVYTDATPTWGVQFAIKQVGIDWTPLDISSDYPYVGSFSLFQASLGACISGPVVVATLRYFSNGNSPCGTIEFDYSTAGVPSRILCDFSEEVIAGGHLYVNGTYHDTDYDFDCGCPMPVPAEETTWGRVKSLYGN